VLGVTNSGGPSNQLKDIQKTRQVKNEMVKASIKFNLKPKNGINYLIQTGHIQKDPVEEQIAGIV
jgi:Sec7-like guanine-nucleotide exchange factor